jgi:exosortase/archaeosortase family protein
MTGYAVRFAVLAPLFFALLYFEGFSPLIFVNEMQTELTAFLTEEGIALFAMPIRMDGNTLLFEHGMRLYIVNDCNGLAPVLFFWSAVLAFPTLLKRKVSWLLAGYAALTALNMIRIIAIAYGVTLDAESFGWSHNIVGRYGMGLFTLALFWIFTLSVEIRRQKRALSLLVGLPLPKEA